MKKLVIYITILLFIFMATLTVNVFAVSLDTIDVSTSKQTIHPGENITVNINFGKQLGSYTFDVAYDNNLFEYVYSEGVTTPNDNGTRVRLYYADQTGGTNPRNNTSVTFKAKEDIITSNPTNFSITAEGLANPDASVQYDDITIPIVKNVIVEPKYEDYKISLKYDGSVLVNEEKDMKLTISSAMGKNYEHTRIIAEAKTPQNATAKLLATDSQSLEHDIIQSGWGDASGDKIGGKDVVKQLDVRGLFDKQGKYEITLKLIDRDNSDAIIANETFNINVTEKATPPEGTTKPENKPEKPENSIKPETTNPDNNTNKEETNTQKEPTELPKTGDTIYLLIIPVIATLLISYFALKKQD